MIVSAREWAVNTEADFTVVLLCDALFAVTVVYS